MGYQITKDNIIINKNKSIGNVLFIVEGSDTEFYILGKIFKDILNYTYEGVNRENKEFKKYQNPTKTNSRVFVINTENSHISSIKNQQDYLDDMFMTLGEKYRFDIDNSSIYFIFDRDRDPKHEADSHREYIRNLIRNLTNALDIDDSRSDEFKFDRQGLMLLSYPAIEAFTASNFINEVHSQSYKIGKELKRSLADSKINQSKINEDSLKCAICEMLRYFSTIHSEELDIDYFSKLNLKIFDGQEQYYNSSSTYRVLSLLCIALIDLGIIEIEI